MLSIIIPTLNCRDDLQRTLDALALRPANWEIIVSDGGSIDGTQAIAELAKARLVIGAPGRGRQLKTGAEIARGPWLLFWHADTRPQPGWVVLVERFIKDPEHAFHAAYFNLVLNDPNPAARRIERLANWRAKTFNLPYGDQGLLISEDYYQHLGGFKPIALMEDVDLVRRIGPKRLHALPSAAVTSARKYRRDGWWGRPIKNLICLGLYYLGVPISIIVRLYR